MSSAYFDRDQDKHQKSGIRKLLGPVFAMAWISLVGSITYAVLMFTGLLPEEMRLSAMNQMLNPELEQEDPEAIVAEAGIDPNNLAMLAMAAQTLGNSNVGLAATDLLEAYDDDAFAMMQQMDLKGGTMDYAAMLSQLPPDMIGTEMSEDEAFAELVAHSMAMEEMQGLLNEAGYYDGPIDGLDQTGSIENVEEEFSQIAETAAAMTAEDGAAPAEGDLAQALTDLGLVEAGTDYAKSMTDTAVERILDEQRFTVPMLDTETSDIKKIKAYKSLMENPGDVLSGETETSVRFIKSYMLPHTLLTDAIRFREAGETERALNALRLIFRAFPEHPMTGDALLLLSDIQDSRGETDASKRTLNTFLTVHGGHVRAVDGVVRYSDWQMASGEGLPAACRWLTHVSVYPPALNARGLQTVQRAAALRDCYGSRSTGVAGLRSTRG
ncbi:MAG: hypothetical protein AAGJ32_08440 [Pseudomonadota bacterium]